MPRKKRRADGTLRPAVRRRRTRLNKIKRAAWLSEFHPGHRARFERETDLTRAVWLGAYTRDTRLHRSDAADLLGKVGHSLGWAVLQTRSGLTVGIAPWLKEKI